jgi:hypothetical protein
MALVDLVCRQSSTDCIEKLSKEYWEPTRQWKCWEFIGHELTVARVEPWPDKGMLAGAKYRYGLDRDVGMNLCD